jgi:AraC-like DNA-binding protein
MEHITLANVAQQINLSPSHLSQIFHKECGRTFTEHLTHRRITRACELLQDPRFNISEISLLAGYETPRHFSQTFKRLISIPPQRIQKARVGCKISALTTIDFSLTARTIGISSTIPPSSAANPRAAARLLPVPVK